MDDFNLISSTVSSRVPLQWRYAASDDTHMSLLTRKIGFFNDSPLVRLSLYDSFSKLIFAAEWITQRSRSHLVFKVSYMELNRFQKHREYLRVDLYSHVLSPQCPLCELFRSAKSCAPTVGQRRYPDSKQLSKELLLQPIFPATFSSREARSLAFDRIAQLPHDEYVAQCNASSFQRLEAIITSYDAFRTWISYCKARHREDCRLRSVKILGRMRLIDCWSTPLKLVNAWEQPDSNRYVPLS
jgi:hypothetical protein